MKSTGRPVDEIGEDLFFFHHDRWRPFWILRSLKFRQFLIERRRSYFFADTLSYRYVKLEPDGTEVELASTFRVIVLRTAKMELSHNNY